LVTSSFANSEASNIDLGPWLIMEASFIDSDVAADTNFGVLASYTI